ncbi:MAG: acyl-CoA dehydrogenase family protein [Candidatus Thermoplasmatota archaeon]
MDFQLTDEQVAIQRMVREFAQNEVAPEIGLIEEKGVWNSSVLKKAAELGLAGMTIPTEFGGTGLDTISYNLAIQELSRINGSVGITFAAHCGLGSSHINIMGTREQKAKYLPKLASGEHWGAWGLTEPGAGSDAAGLATIATRDTAESRAAAAAAGRDSAYRGPSVSADRDGDGWTLNGQKVFCTNGHFANTFTLMAKTDPAKGAKGITAFVIEKGAKGLVLGKLEEKLGLHGSSTSQIFLEDCWVSDSQVLGLQPGLGAGFTGAMRTLDAGRIAIGSLALGMAQGAYETALAYAKERQQFGKPIGSFQGIQFKLASMATELDAARLLLLRAAWLKDQGRDFSMAASMGKVYASEAAMRAATECIQILGGNGYTTDYPVERHFRDIKLCEIGEGSSEVQRMVIAKAIGLPVGR